MSNFHTPVLMEETLEALSLRPGARIIDGTVGDGGHTEAILTRANGAVIVLGIDLDEKALRTTATRLAKWGTSVILRQGNFKDMATIAEEAEFGSPTGILLDLGIRSAEIEESGLGFSFQRDEPLVMRFDGTTNGLTAASIVNGWRMDEILQVLREYGEETFALRIAKAIVEARRQNRIERTGQLAEIIWNAVPVSVRHGRTHPATRAFQALRIAVNDELGGLKEALPAAVGLLAPGGTLAVISFHSLEDRIVKTAFRDFAKRGLGSLTFKKPIEPTPKEVEENPRSRSAKLRAFKKIV